MTTSRFMSFTAQEVDDLIEDGSKKGWSYFMHYMYEKWLEDEHGNLVKDQEGRLVKDPSSLKGVFYPELEGWVSTVDDYGGEGQGDDYWVVVKVTPDDFDSCPPRFFKKPGWYASFVGGELDGDCIEVKPVERKVTFYE